MTERAPVIAFVWRDAHAERGGEMTRSVAESLAELGAATRTVRYSDGTIDEATRQLSEVDGALVWVNPIQDGATRASLDPLLREIADRGVYVSAHPDTIMRMGTKEVLFRTRDLGWGTDTEIYRGAAEMADRFPQRLARRGTLVVKQGRGTAGEGTWKVELIPAHAEARRVLVRVQHAATSAAEAEEITLGVFLDRCAAYFAWSGCVIDQPFVPRLADGMVRAYLSGDVVTGFCHQWPKGLLDSAAEARRPSARSAMEGADAPPYQDLRAKLENEWVPAMRGVLGIARDALPAIWDADFLYGPKTASGADTYVLCEINVSAVWPFPPQGATTIAETVMSHVRARTRA